MGKIFNKGLSEDDKKEGLFKRLKNIENAQKGLINGNNKTDNARSKLSLPSIFNRIKVEMKMKMKMKKLHVNFFKMELRV